MIRFEFEPLLGRYHWLLVVVRVVPLICKAAACLRPLILDPVFISLVVCVSYLVSRVDFPSRQQVST
jgi:hypothetical protein